MDEFENIRTADIVAESIIDWGVDVIIKFSQTFSMTFHIQCRSAFELGNGVVIAPSEADCTNDAYFAKTPRV